MSCDPNRQYSHHAGCECHEARHAKQIADLTEALEHTVQRIRDFEDYIAGRRGGPPSVHAALAFANKAITATKQ